MARKPQNVEAPNFSNNLMIVGFGVLLLVAFILVGVAVTKANTEPEPCYWQDTAPIADPT